MKHQLRQLRLAIPRTMTLVKSLKRKRFFYFFIFLWKYSRRAYTFTRKVTVMKHTLKFYYRKNSNALWVTTTNLYRKT